MNSAVSQILHPIQASPRGVVFLSHSRCFSNTTTLYARRRKTTRQRIRMLQWLRGPGAVFRIPRSGSTNYLSAYDKEGKLNRAKAHGKEAGETEEETNDQDLKENKEQLPPETAEDLRPFPLNPFFRSPPVLSLRLRDEVYERVVGKGQSIREVSQILGIDMNRVGAVIRLKRVELDWLREGKPLALDFRNKILAMLPRTRFDPSAERNPRHESINDLPVHPMTLPQLFHPASESAQFTRAEAGRVFHRGLLAADDRIPHPDMIESAREESAGISQGQRHHLQRERWQKEEAEVKAKEDERKRRQEERETIVPGKRWDFRFERVHADKTGNGRDPRGVGWRYGMPLPDRKKGAVRIPTQVD